MARLIKLLLRLHSQFKKSFSTSKGDTKMAKKGGVQQLQIDINTNEELAKFMERDGLIVLDVYTEWCGPCLAMVGSLKKIKLEQGGDDLQLAVVKCDHIDALKRFRNKSEPTWLLASKGRVVNAAFGSNVPELMDLIIKELDIERRMRDTDTSTNGREYFELDELTPIEMQRATVKRLREEENERLEVEAARKRRHEYLMKVTDEIIANANDLGVTVLMPHVMSRDLLKRLTDPADKCQLVVKDKKVTRILDEHLEALTIENEEAMPKHVLKHILDRDVFCVCWKVSDPNFESMKAVQEYLADFASLVWNPNSADESTEHQSIFRALSIEVDVDEAKNGEQDEKPATEVETTKKKIQIPPIWAPAEQRTNAALIYLYFRTVTETFLPVDPPPEIPHIAMVFDAYKRKDLMNVIDRHREDILAYGYFTNENHEVAELIATSTFNYQQKPPSIFDKFVLKVWKKKGSPAMAELYEHGPCYVSENAEIGRIECFSFFPPGYKISSETGETTPIPTNDRPRKKKKRRKVKSDAEADAVDNGEKKTSDEASNDQDSANDGLDDDDENKTDDEDDDEDIENENGDAEATEAN